MKIFKILCMIYLVVWAMTGLMFWYCNKHKVVLRTWVIVLLITLNPIAWIMRVNEILVIWIKRSIVSLRNYLRRPIAAAIKADPGFKNLIDSCENTKSFDEAFGDPFPWSIKET